MFITWINKKNFNPPPPLEKILDPHKIYFYSHFLWMPEIRWNSLTIYKTLEIVGPVLGIPYIRYKKFHVVCYVLHSWTHQFRLLELFLLIMIYYSNITISLKWYLSFIIRFFSRILLNNLPLQWQMREPMRIERT